MAWTAQDQLDVMDLFTNYALAIDDGRAEDYANNFMPDALMIGSAGDERRGRAAILTWIRGMIGDGNVGSDPATLRHFIGLPLISGDDDKATAKTVCVILDYDPEKKIRVPLVATYHDNLVKVDGRWMFQTRVVKGDLGRRSV
jgi:uncharacterized protein (TIGR02246 family)